MKNAPLIILCMFLTATGCRKDLNEINLEKDVTNKNMEGTKPDLNAIRTHGISASEWQSTTSWNEVTLPSHTVFYSDLPSEITDVNSEKGFITVFTSGIEGNSPRALPFEENVNGQKYYWYYLVKKNSVMIAVDAYNSKTNPAINSRFQTLVFSGSALSEIENKGKTKEDLLHLSYDNLGRLLSK